MPVTLMLPGALLPREAVRALHEPLSRTALASLLSRGELGGDTETEPPAHLAWLAERLLARGASAATAPYAWADLTGAPSDAYLWHADPVHLELARDHLVLTPLAAPPTADESPALLDAANALAAEAGAHFVRAQDRWFLQTEHPWDVQAPPLSAAIGRPLQHALPAGGDAARWNRLLTEIQMAWHMLPVNEAREARGEATVNSVWLYGGGRWAPLRPGEFTAVLSDAPEWRGAAAAALLPSGPGDAAPRDGALVVWSELMPARQLEDWDRWLAELQTLDLRLAALARNTALDLVLSGGRVVRRVIVRPGDRLKFWRTNPLEQVLSE